MGSDDLVSQSVKTGAPIRDNTVSVAAHQTGGAEVGHRLGELVR
jgi:hypothetical protein